MRRGDDEAIRQHKERWAKDAPDVPYGLCQCGCGEKTTLAPKSHTAYGYVVGQPRRFLVGHGSRATGPDYIVEDRGFDTPCWVWGRARFDTGYGSYNLGGGKAVGAHRRFYEEHVREIPRGHDVHHLCGVRPCVNPAHLQAILVKRHRRMRAQAKVTAEIAHEMRRLYATGEYGQWELARRFGLHNSSVSRIVNGKTWA